MVSTALTMLASACGSEYGHQANLWPRGPKRLEFALHAPATLTAGTSEPTSSFTLAVNPQLTPPVRFWQCGSLTFFVRKQQEYQGFPSEMTYIGPDARRLEDETHRADKACRTVHSGCVATIEWPNGTWPSRQ